MKLRNCFPIMLCVSAIVLSGCQSSNKGKSAATGWAYNDPAYGGFEVKDAYAQITGPGLVFVEGGAFLMGSVAQDLGYEWNNQPRKVTVDSYFIDETERTNRDYREYLHWLKRVYVSYPNVYQNALPDTLVWRRPLAYNEPYVMTYLRHPAYDEYPVVGVSWRQACDYCLWRTDRVNEEELVRAGILKRNPEQRDADHFNTEAYLLGQYEGIVDKGLRDYSSADKRAIRSATFEDGILLPNYRLPTEAEWEYAAVGRYAHDELVPDRRIYPWDGAGMRSGAKDTRGLYLANFQRGRGDLMGVAGARNDGYAGPAPVRSFMPNDFGLYCMAGNVNEWVADVYRPLSFSEVEDFRPFRGNVFTEYEKDAGGDVIKKDELGRIRRDTIGYLPNRQNYRMGDNRNYRDGDIISSIYFEGTSTTPPDTVANSNRMYNTGEGSTYKGMTSLISDRSRVYKGGSFLDRAYWLSPGTRRFLDEERSEVDLGFRCAMDKLGETQVAAKKKR